MDDRRTPEPESPFSDALSRTPEENARDAEKGLDQPDRKSVTEANQDGPDQGERPDGPKPEVVDRVLNNPPG